MSAEGPNIDALAPLQRITDRVVNAPPITRPVIPARHSAPESTSGRRPAAGPIDASLPGAKPPNPASELNPPSPSYPIDYGASANSLLNARERESSAAACENNMLAEEPLSHGINEDDGQQADFFGLKTFGFDIDVLNREFALVLLGSKAVVFREQPDALIEDQQRMLTLDAFNAWFANRFTERRDADGKVKRVTWAKAWQQSRQRRQYGGVEFHPDRDNKGGTPGYLNLWSGFAFAPAEKPDATAYSIFRDHLLTNVCGGDESKFRWVFGFFADMVQRPRNRVGVALVLRGKMGSGKTKIGEVFGSLIPRHYFLVNHARYVTGNFNTHMASCLLLQADEAVWAGDKEAEGVLKSLITAPIQLIEAKGIDAIRLTNYVRLVMTSNEDWVVPAGKDERRFTVLDVDPRCAQDHGYFREMDEQLASGGLAHLLGDLLAFDLDSVNLRQILRTEALLEQKIRSLNSVESWWFERLHSGAILRDGTPWPTEVVCGSLFDDYIAIADKIGIKRKQEEAVFGMQLGKLVPDLKRRRASQVSVDEYGASVVRRPWVYVIPSIDSVRESFESLVGQKIDWPPLDGERTAVREDVVL